MWQIISYNILCGQIIKFGIPSLQPQTEKDLSTAIVSGIKMNTHINKKNYKPKLVYKVHLWNDLHKNPYRKRYIASSSTCSIKELPITMTKSLSGVKEELQSYCVKVFFHVVTSITCGYWKTLKTFWLGWLLCSICVTNDHRYIPLVVNTSRSFPHSWRITGCT